MLEKKSFGAFFYDFYLDKNKYYCYFVLTIKKQNNRTMKTYLILTDETETSFRIDTTAWEREVDDTMIIDGTPMRIVAIYKREADRNEAWRILSAAIRRRNNRIRRRQAAEQNKAFASILMSAAKSAGIDEADAVSALRHLMS